MCKVSVIIPVYNAEMYLRDCLDSLIIQTLKEIEIICINDGSTDSSAYILEEYKHKDTRIIIQEQKNSYAGVARNRGLKLAKGEYVIFLDADDFFDIHMLEDLYQKAAAHSADVSMCGAEYYNEQTKEYINAQWILNIKMLHGMEVFSSDDAAEYIYNFVKAAPWNKMFRREFVLRERLMFQDTKRANDIYFVFLALSLAGVITVIDKALVHYRIGMSTNLQASRNETPLDFLHALLKLKEELVRRNCFHKFEKSFVNMALANCIYNLENESTDKFLNSADSLKLRGRGRDYFYNKEEYDKYLMKINQNEDASNVLLSVVIPMYKREKEISRCLDSVLEQTLKGLEIIVIDDGSPDDGYKIVEAYAAKFHNIFLFRQENKGLGAARNAGIEKAYGKYIVFLDADDYVPCDAYKKLYEYIEQKQADVVVGNMQRCINGFDLFIPGWMNALFEKYEGKNCAKNFIVPLQNPSAVNKMIKLSLIRERGIRFSEARLAEDLEFAIDLFDASDRVYLRNESVYVYMINSMPGSSLTFTTSAAAVDAGLDVMKRVSLYFHKRGLIEEEQMFITGPVSWLWDRFWQIGSESEKYAEYDRFKELLQNYDGMQQYQNAVVHVFKVPAGEFIQCTYTEYQSRFPGQTPEEIVLGRLQSSELGFRYIFKCLKVRLVYKLKKMLKEEA